MVTVPPNMPMFVSFHDHCCGWFPISDFPKNYFKRDKWKSFRFNNSCCLALIVKSFIYLCDEQNYGLLDELGVTLAVKPDRFEWKPIHQLSGGQQALAALCKWTRDFFDKGFASIADLGEIFKFWLNRNSWLIAGIRLINCSPTAFQVRIEVIINATDSQLLGGFFLFRFRLYLLVYSWQSTKLKFCQLSCPLFLFDEVDASLDAVNTTAVEFISLLHLS
jgi:hypothetical protein